MVYTASLTFERYGGNVIKRTCGICWLSTIDMMKEENDRL